MWIDDENSCSRTYRIGFDSYPSCRGGDHHLYYDENFRIRWATRCPKSLSKDEQTRVFWDQPPGSANGRVKEYLAFLKDQR